MRRGSRSSSQPGQLLIARLTRRLLVQVNELDDLLFDGVQQLPAGALAAAAGLGAHLTVLVHLGMSLALVTAVLAHRRAGLKERLDDVGVVSAASPLARAGQP